MMSLIDVHIFCQILISQISMYSSFPSSGRYPNRVIYLTLVLAKKITLSAIFFSKVSLSNILYSFERNSKIAISPLPQ